MFTKNGSNFIASKHSPITFFIGNSYCAAISIGIGIQVSGAGGHSHGSGNPHYWLDPLNAEVITKTILLALISVDPAGERIYENS
ncbi:MAG: hypothetical protein EBV04_02140, partial [Actinobacteria bacterium]|nr:hypothetical protein [Actinomycetota bacterium]